MAVLDFKSVGDLSTASQFQPKVNNIPIGIRTPLRLGSKSDGIFAMHYDISDQVQDNFRNLLLTNWGERVGLYDFGANLKPLTLELGRDDFDQQAMIRIKTAVNKHMPFIQPQTFESRIDTRDTGLARVVIRITYDVPRLNITSKAIEVIMTVGG